MKLELDYDLCMAAGKDAGNRNMRKHGRKAWNREDWNVACAEVYMLHKIEVEQPEMDNKGVQDE